jgi:leucine dehydrogenase
MDSQRQESDSKLDPEHEQIVYRHDRETGLRAIIAIHDTRLGPAAGGCRYWHYPGVNEALTDALRLSRGMTFKNALADIPFGGGKSVLLARPDRRLSDIELRVFGRWIEELSGRYVTAEDVGMRVADMRLVAEETRYVSGLGQHGIGGDPSPATAEGVLLGMKAAVRARLGAADLEGIRVAVQGLGNVGYDLCRRLCAADARLMVADLDQAAVERVVSEFGALAVAPDEILSRDVDVFAPCALGGVLTVETAERLRASVVAGSANNQLLTPEVAAILRMRGVLYAPDYVINAGGVISVAAEYLSANGGTIDGGCRDWIRGRIEGISARLEEIFAEAERSGRTTDEIAEEMALRVIERGPRGALSSAVSAV